MARPNQARLDLKALRHNLDVARGLAPDSRLMAIVKANAYGHGAVTIARALESGADALAVACLEEAIELREGGVTAPVLLLEGVFELSELLSAAKLDLWVTIDNERQMRWLEEAPLPEPLHCWLKVDTGMHRLGIPAQATPKFFQRLLDCKNCKSEPVLYTHFATADDIHHPMTTRQIALFEKVCSGLPARLSAANSAGLLARPDAQFDWVRPGYMLYGNSPMVASHPGTAILKPVMTLSSAIISLREVAEGDTVGYGATWTASRTSRIATVTIGYGDGYPRLARNGTPVLVNGLRAPLAGRVSMDMITIDVTDLPNVDLGDEVILWGNGLPVEEVAAHADTIGYELLTRMPARTPRVVSRD